MASESVKQTVSDLLAEAAEREGATLKAFSGMDASVFRQWAMAVSDIMACGTEDSAPESVRTASGLIYQLIVAADELQEKESREMRERLAKA